MTTAQTIEPGPVVSHLEADTFCPQCSYNLVTQAVLKDERLEILIVRCPECGKFSAAGQGTTAARIWLDRFATMMLGSWVLLVLLVFASCTYFQGLVAYGHLTVFTETSFDSMASNPRGHHYNYYYRVATVNPHNLDAIEQARWRLGILGSAAVLFGVAAGVFFSVFLWHCSGWRRRLALVMPIVGCGATAFLWLVNPQAYELTGWGLSSIGVYLCLEMLGVMIGSVIGRPIARFMLKLVLPPRPRQHLAFMWTVDGKKLRLD